ncbi:MAG: hypothetical protein QNK04_15715 [Myxococcota bacterium]|nr:hypothetical protein [Myxococcota bacterium]
MKNSIRALPWAAALASLAVGFGLLAMGVLIANAGRIDAVRVETIAPGASLASVERLAGGKAERCLYAGPGRELCRWEIEGRLVDPSGPQPIQDPETGPIILVCELPSDGSQAQQGTCFVGSRPFVSTLPPVSAASDAAERVRLAAEALDAARDVTALSRLVGDAPDACRTRWGGQMCVWRLEAGMPGSARLAALADGEGQKELRCLLPLADPRPDGSCAVVSADAAE